MKILKNLAVVSVVILCGCSSETESTEQNTVIEETPVIKSKTAYTLTEILNGIRAWDSIRSNDTALAQLFDSTNSLKIDMASFPAGNNLHAYACLLENELKFAVISEFYDKEEYHDEITNYIKIIDGIYTNTNPLSQNTYADYNFPLPTQYITSTEALFRITNWNYNYTNWLQSTTYVYQLFDIPTYSLSPQVYTGYFGLKTVSDDEGVDTTEADLVLDNSAGLFFDTVILYPPLRDRTYYLIELL